MRLYRQPSALGLDMHPAGLEPATCRQNVIFELGYFVAKLGCKKVCALYEEGVEIPSDYKGVIFVPLDVGGA